MSKRIKRAGYRSIQGEGRWRKEPTPDTVMELEQAGSGDHAEWWLYLAADAEMPRMTFAGSLRSCLHVDRKIVKLIREGRIA